MKTIGGINPKNLKIKCIALDFDDIIASGAINPRVKRGKALELLQKLSEIEKHSGGFVLALVSGYSRVLGQKKLEESGFAVFFKPENVFFAGQDYLDSMAEVDRQRHNANVAKNAFFQDDYFKQKALEKLLERESLDKSRVFFVAHDLLTDAYYSQRFSRVQVALVKGALSLRHVPITHVVKGLVYVNLDWKDFRKLLLGRFPEEDFSFLRRFVENYLARELVGRTQLAAGLLGKARLAEKKKQSS